ncbi:MAG TPA: MCE family protein [Acidimicrobiales bacterium]|nr:MCE family protein [Acidimicrobiales bacterium]
MLAVVALAVAMAGCSLPGRVEGPVELTAVFDDVGDLVTGHSVQMADVRIGSVTRIELTDDHRARVTMRVKDGLGLPANTQAVLRTTSLLGEKFIELRPPRDDDGRPLPATGTLASGAVIEETLEAPELEFVAEEAVQVLAGVVTDDLATIIETGAVGFGGRASELASLVDSLGVVSRTLAEQTGSIVAIIDSLDRASATVAGGSDEIDRLLANLAETTAVLAENRDLTLQTLRDLTRLAQAQNDLVFEPFRDDLERQLAQLDQLLAVVASQRQEVATLVDWLAEFATRARAGIPEDFAQLYAWLQLAPLDDAQ